MYLALALLSSLVLGSADFVGGAAARRARAAVVVVWSNAAGLLAALVLVVLVVPGAVSPRDLGWGVSPDAMERAIVEQSTRDVRATRRRSASQSGGTPPPSPPDQAAGEREGESPGREKN